MSFSAPDPATDQLNILSQILQNPEALQSKIAQYLQAKADAEEKLALLTQADQIPVLRQAALDELEKVRASQATADQAVAEAQAKANALRADAQAALDDAKVQAAAMRADAQRGVEDAQHRAQGIAAEAAAVLNTAQAKLDESAAKLAESDAHLKSLEQALQDAKDAAGSAFVAKDKYDGLVAKITAVIQGA